MRTRCRKPFPLVRFTLASAVRRFVDHPAIFVVLQLGHTIVQTSFAEGWARQSRRHIRFGLLHLVLCFVSWFVSWLAALATSTLIEVELYLQIVS
jgi:hypothetical protein